MERTRWAWEGWWRRAGGGEERRRAQGGLVVKEGTDLEGAVEIGEDRGVGAGAGRTALVQQAIDAQLVGGSIGEGG